MKIDLRASFAFSITAGSNLSRRSALCILLGLHQGLELDHKPSPRVVFKRRLGCGFRLTLLDVDHLAIDLRQLGHNSGEVTGNPCRASVTRMASLTSTASDLSSLGGSSIVRVKSRTGLTMRAGSSGSPFSISSRAKLSDPIPFSGMTWSSKSPNSPRLPKHVEFHPLRFTAAPQLLRQALTTLFPQSRETSR